MVTGRFAEGQPPEGFLDFGTRRSRSERKEEPSRPFARNDTFFHEAASEQALLAAGGARCREPAKLPSTSLRASSMTPFFGVTGSKQALLAALSVIGDSSRRFGTRIKRS